MRCAALRCAALRCAYHTQQGVHNIFKTEYIMYTNCQSLHDARLSSIPLPRPARSGEARERQTRLFHAAMNLSHVESGAGRQRRRHARRL